MEEPFDFGKRLQELRKQKGYSQSFVAERVNVSKQSIYGYENNVQSPSVETLVDLALLYNVSTDFLLGLDKRKSFYIDGFNENNYLSILQILDIIKNDFDPKA